MLFNSYEFVLGFLPVAAIVFFSIGAASRAWAFRWLILASIFFYAWWRPFNLLIITPSILVNYFLAIALMRLNRQGRAGSAKIVLAIGIVFNISVLGYFKYANFFVDSINDVAGTGLVLAQIILPLGISFITFQKIAFLVDVHGRRIESLKFEDYSLFVLFFPQLIAGPIVHYREVMPQFRNLSCKFDPGNVAVGLTLFCVGLFKKVVLADSIAPAVSSIYAHASTGAELSLLPAWMAAVGFTLQIYFDFSGYTDMALGAARLFGVRLPPNFDSPLRASSIIEFWSRWHMTLTRFLTAYVYNPLVLSLTRRRLAKGHRPSRDMTAGAFVQLLAFPTLVTMFVSGMWHGAGYLFILWGLLHGVFLVVNHAWREFGPRTRLKSSIGVTLATQAAFLLTAGCVVASMVVFRSPNLLAAKGIFEGMLGLHGWALPESIYDRLGPLIPLLQSLGIGSGLGFDLPVVRAAALMALLGVIALAFPNSLQLLGPHEAALGWKAAPNSLGSPRRVEWRPSLAWAVAISAMASAAALRLGAESEFLYWQF